MSLPSLDSDIAALHIDQEARRLALQETLDRQKTSADRNQLGQFATPGQLARAIATQSLAFLRTYQPIRYLEPGVGTGAFYSALSAIAAPDQIISHALGIEIDDHYAIPTQALWKSTPLRIQNADFTALAPPSDERERFNLILCNPPYVRHHHLQNQTKLRLQRLTESVFGRKITGLAGLYCYFLAATHDWMQRDGIAAWLIPSEFMTVNYGQTVRDYLLNKVTLLRIHRFSPNDVQFTDALVSSAVVFFKNALPPAGHTVQFTYGGRLPAPADTIELSLPELREESKWTRFQTRTAPHSTSGPTISHFFQVRRGLATGDNSFFILTPEQIALHQIPSEFLRPILPSSRYVKEDEISADEHGNPINIKPLFLIDCSLPESDIQKNHPSLWAYLQTGIDHVSTRYLCRTRKPWYKQEQRASPPFICTYLGRQDNKSGRPFRIMLNHSQAVATNVYLLLYPKPPLAKALALNPSLTKQVWQALNTIQPDDFLNQGRVYGGGLHKLEPSELGNVSALQLQNLLAAYTLEQQRLHI